MWYLYLQWLVRNCKGSVEVLFFYICICKSSVEVLFVYIWNRKSSVEVARVRSWFLKVRVQPWAKITRGRAVFVIPGLKERDAANNYNCICSVFPQCLSVFSCHTSNIYYHFIISSRSTCLPETSKMCSLQILGLNPTNVFTCHAGPVLHQSRCDVSLENGDGRWNPGRPFSTMLTVISMQSFVSIGVSSLLVYVLMWEHLFLYINQNNTMGILRSLPQYFGFLPLPSSRTFVTSQLYGWQPHRMNVGVKYNSTFWCCWYFIYKSACPFLN